QGCSSPAAGCHAFVFESMPSELIPSANPPQPTDHESISRSDEFLHAPHRRHPHALMRSAEPVLRFSDTKQFSPPSPAPPPNQFASVADSPAAMADTTSDPRKKYAEATINPPPTQPVH